VLVPVYGYYVGYYFLTLEVANDLIVSTPFHSGDQFVFSFPTTSGFTNVVEYTGSLNPANWQPFATNIGDGNVHFVTNSPTTSTNRFFRARFQ
jgi:hypothetical protein